MRSSKEKKGNKTCVWLAVGISLLCLTSTAMAQEEQWLQYRSSRESNATLGGENLQELELIFEKPSGVKLPQFKAENQFFAKWPTPMIKSGRLWIALDSKGKQGRWDRLFIDSNGDGHLNDEDAVTAYRTEQYYTHFGPVQVVFEVEDGPVIYHLNILFRNGSEKDRGLYVSSGGWYEGSVTVGGAKKHCVLFDYNANGTFNDKSLNSAECDRIQIGKRDIQNTLFAGNYIDVDGVLYLSDVARDGAYIKLTKAEDVRLGNVRLPESITEFSAGGENGLFTLEPEKGIGSLPVGKYYIHCWAIERKDEEGTQWKLQGSGVPPGERVFDIVEARDTEISIGKPIHSVLDTQSKKDTHSFSYNLRGRDGESIKLTRSGARPPVPKLRIKNENGSYDRAFSFAYG